MSQINWTEEFPAAITVVDAKGIIIAMNERSAATFASYGGKKLIGRQLIDVHPEQTRPKVAALLASRQPNCYTIENNGIKKIVYQSPWYQEGQFAGYVELSLELPPEVPHYVRK